MQYQEMGFLKERHSAEGVDNGVYEKVVTRKATNIEGLGDTIATSKNAFRLSGYLGCYKIADLFTFNHTEDRSDDLTFLPYWVTLDGVQVTGMVKRTAHWEGEGNYVSGGFDYRGLHIADRDGQYSLSSVAPVSNTPMMISAMFRDDNLTIPEGPVEPDPMTVGVEFETVTAGKSGNVKALELTADLSEFDYDDAWFEVNGEWIETEDLDGGIFAEFSLKGLKKETQLTIVPCWQSGDETFYGAELVLEVVKKTVTVAEEPAEELSEETAEEFVEEYAEEFVEETEEESVEESGKKNDKKSDKKSKKKNDKKSNEEFAEEFVEEIMTVAVISRGQPVAKASVTVDEGTLGMILQ